MFQLSDLHKMTNLLQSLMSIWSAYQEFILLSRSVRLQSVSKLCVSWKSNQILPNSFRFQLEWLDATGLLWTPSGKRLFYLYHFCRTFHSSYLHQDSHVHHTIATHKSTCENSFVFFNSGSLWPIKLSYLQGVMVFSHYSMGLWPEWPS